MICYITHHMLFYITDDTLCYITYHTSYKEDYQVLRISYKGCLLQSFPVF